MPAFTRRTYSYLLFFSTILCQGYRMLLPPRVSLMVYGVCRGWKRVEVFLRECSTRHNTRVERVLNLRDSTFNESLKVLCVAWLPLASVQKWPFYDSALRYLQLHRLGAISAVLLPKDTFSAILLPQWRNVSHLRNILLREFSSQLAFSKFLPPPPFPSLRSFFPPSQMFPPSPLSPF